jgi:hypothetical protein
MQNLRHFPLPPRGVPLTVQRAGDRVIILGRKGSPATDARGGTLTFPAYTFGFLGAWRIVVVVLLGVGGLILFASLLLVLFGDQPLLLNGKPVHNRFIAALLVLAVLGAFVVIGWIMLRGGARIDRIMSGEFGGWRLELARHAWTATDQDPIHGGAKAGVKPETIRRISIDGENRLLAESEADSIHLTPKLAPETATWLRDALCRHLGIRP